jgi:hypothetical protein
MNGLPLFVATGRFSSGGSFQNVDEFPELGIGCRPNVPGNVNVTNSWHWK